MLKARVIPCLSIKGNALVKTIGFKNATYVGDPINAVKIFNDKEVDELMFLDITASLEKKGPNFKLLTEIASECFMPFGYGGGITTMQEIEQLFNIGVEKVILNSSANTNIGLLTQAALTFGSQSIVASMDVRMNWLTQKQSVYTHSGKHNSKISPDQYVRKMEDAGAGEIILNSIDLDGTMKGYDIELIKSVSQKVNIPLVALGGAGSIEDFIAAIQAGASAVAASSYFIFQKTHRAVLITYPSQTELERIR